jgi:aminomethyltransferase
LPHRDLVGSRNVKKTTLHDVHLGLGAKMVEFAGWEMPVYYEGIMAEHRVVRETVGLFDVSHMGEIELRGPGFIRYADTLLSNAVAKLEVGQAQYTVMCYESGGIIDDLLAYRFEDHMLLVVNAANTEKDFQWVTDHLPDDAEAADISSAVTQLALQGPRADDVLARLTDIPIRELPFYRFTVGQVAGIRAVVSRTGYTGERGFELYVREDERGAEALWDALMEAGSSYSIAPIGLGARDTLRLEMGYCLYGNDISRDTNPLEAGLGWVTKLKKGPFVGRDRLLEVKESGIRRRLSGLQVAGHEIPRPGYPIYDGQAEVGVVTSGGFGPSVGKGIALGYVPSELAQEGLELQIGVRGRRVQARTTKPPFYRHGSLR